MLEAESRRAIPPARRVAVPPGGNPSGMNPLTFGPALVKRALDDLSAIADAVGRLTTLEGAVVGGLHRIETRLDALRDDVQPIRTIEDVNAAVQPLQAQLDQLHESLDGLRTEVGPISEIRQVRAGIEPLDEDMRAVRLSVDDLEPLIRQVNERLAGLDQRIETLRGDLAPLGELAEKVPGIGR
jgi:prefoldin subunit 5